MSRAAATRKGDILIGISGWRYGGWRGGFYPKGLRQKDELAYASRQVDTIEINGTHYSLQHPESFAQWHDETPDGFVFAVKGSRFITHMKQLRVVEAPLANFFAQGVLRLEAKLGPLLWQFSPRFRFDAEKLDGFFALLPRDTEAAAALAERPGGSAAGPGPASKSAAHCGTRSRSGIRAFSTPLSCGCCAGTISRWSSPMQWIGPMPRI